jgi:hypothetical protein
MKKYFTLAVIGLTLFSCGGIKKTQQALNGGNYEYAITVALEKLNKNKSQKRADAYLLILEEAFQKNTVLGKQQIENWIAEDNPEHIESIFYKLQNLNRIQERIRSLLPLYLKTLQRDAHFKFEAYQELILTYRSKLSAHLYDVSQNLIVNAQSKTDFKRAYINLSKLESINPNYKDTRILLQETKNKAMYLVLLRFENLTDFQIPETLELELLDTRLADQHNEWAKFHRYPESNSAYDYEIVLALRDAAVSPNQIIERQELIEKKISLGKQVVLNREGEVVKDSVGNPIETDRFTKVKSRFNMVFQQKSGMISGSIAIIDSNTGETHEIQYLSGESNFENRYATQHGDDRALEKWQQRLLKRRPVPFPSNFNMLSEAGAALRSELWDVLNRYTFE